MYAAVQRGHETGRKTSGDYFRQARRLQPLEINHVQDDFGGLKEVSNVL